MAREDPQQRFDEGPDRCARGEVDLLDPIRLGDQDPVAIDQHPALGRREGVAKQPPRRLEVDLAPALERHRQQADRPGLLEARGEAAHPGEPPQQVGVARGRHVVATRARRVGGAGFRGAARDRPERGGRDAGQHEGEGDAGAEGASAARRAPTGLAHEARRIAMGLTHGAGPRWRGACLESADPPDR